MSAGIDHQIRWSLETYRQVTEWDIWIAAVEALVGHDCDGDEEYDGYSLDGLYDMWKAGSSVEDAATAVSQPEGKE